MSGWVRLAAEADLAEGLPLAVRHGDEFLMLVCSGGSIYALDDTCSHEECPLSDGSVNGTEVTCACHGSVFDLRTGEPQNGPAVEPVRTFPVRLEDGEIEVELPA